MHNNGVSHAITADDFDGVLTMLKWLSYMPKVGDIYVQKIGHILFMYNTKIITF